MVLLGIQHQAFLTKAPANVLFLFNLMHFPNKEKQKRPQMYPVCVDTGSYFSKVIGKCIL